MEGRDIGSVVFPETPYKFYIDASPEVRRRRRAAEGQHDEIAARDRADRDGVLPRLSSLREDALVIDSSQPHHRWRLWANIIRPPQNERPAGHCLMPRYEYILLLGFLSYNFSRWLAQIFFHFRTSTGTGA